MKKIAFRKKNCELQEWLSKINNKITKIEELKNKMMLFERVINENSLESAKFLANNIFSACEDIFLIYQPIFPIKAFIP